MIHLGAFSTLEEGIEKVKEVDQNDEQYLKMLMAPKLRSECYIDDLQNNLKCSQHTDFLLLLFFCSYIVNPKILQTV